MFSLKQFTYFLATFALFSNCAQISVGRHDISLVQKRKMYCSMMSYHFLDDDMDTFRAFTEGFSTLRNDVFKSKVANKLSDNCQQKITNQQLIEFSKLVQHPNGHQEEIYNLEHKYIEYFTPEQDILLKLLNEVKSQSEMEMETEIKKFGKSRISIEQHARQVAIGLKEMQKHINETTHQTINSLNRFFESMFHLHGNITTGWSKFHQGLSNSIESIKGKFSQRIQTINTHPHVQKIKDIWNGIWDEDL